MEVSATYVEVIFIVNIRAVIQFLSIALEQGGSFA